MIRRRFIAVCDKCGEEFREGSEDRSTARRPALACGWELIETGMLFCGRCTRRRRDDQAERD